MLWDEIHKQLKTELGREPHSSEVQARLLELFMERIPNQLHRARQLEYLPAFRAESAA